MRISRNLNQPVNGVPPFPTLSTSSPIAPGTPLGVITQVESSGFSSYHAGWVSVSKRLSRGLQLETSYTLSKSLDTNSLNSSGFAVQNSYDIPGQYGLSDFDARHRFVLSATYALPFTGSVLTRGWQIASVIQAQSGNPVNIVTSNSRLTGVANSVRPDVTEPVVTKEHLHALAEGRVRNVPFVGDDGIATTSQDGFDVVSTGVNPTTRERELP